MASIKKRRGTFSVVYTYENENGEKKQRWETFKTYAEAHKRRAEIEYKQNEGTFLPPNKQTVEEIMKDYVALCFQGEVSIPERKALLEQKRGQLLTRIRELEDAVRYIDWKQGFYDDVLSEKTPYVSNLLQN